MADTREPGPTGQAPIDPGLGANASHAPGVGEVRPVKVDMGLGPPPVRSHPEPSPARGVGASILLSAVLSLLCGGAGAWAYERFLAHPAASNPTAGQPARGQDPEVRKELAALEDRIKDLSDRNGNLADQYKQLQARVESLPASAPTSDLGPIEQKVAQVDQLSQRVEAIGNQVAPLPRRLEQYDRRLADLDQKLDELRRQDTAMRFRSPGGQDRQVTLTRADRSSPSTEADRPAASESNESGGSSTSSPTSSSTSSSPSEAPAASTDASLGEGVNLFREGRYSDAYASFRKLLQSQPDDARLWYYAALSYGLATGDWDRMTQAMAEEGVAREKAGKPARPEIDSAFNGLTKQTGKDWLAFYRRRAG